MAHFKDILAVVGSLRGDGHVLDFAQTLALKNDAHLSGLLVNWLPALPAAVEGWIVDARWADLVEEARAVLARERIEFARRLKNSVDRSSDHSVLIDPESARREVALYGRHADLSVVARPGGSPGRDGRMVILEGLLFGAGRPVIVVPPNWSSSAVGSVVMVCWDASREAARAVFDAFSVLAEAARVVVVTVDARPELAGHGEAPGFDIATHLARRGLSVELRNLDSLGRSDADVLCSEAEAIGADLIIMGGYGRSRMREFVFGGVTRRMLEASVRPVFMSH
jgi:nucleotide-binding universal stress UspA family protein